MKKRPFRYPPEERTFKTSDGTKYLHYGRDLIHGKVLEHIKNLKTGERTTMTENELIKLKEQ